MPNLSTLVTNTIPPSSITTDKLAAGCVTPNRLSGEQTGNTPAYAIRAWCYFNGGNTGTFAPTQGGNVTSITRTDTGAYQINFTVPMPTTNYAVVANGITLEGGAAGINQWVHGQPAGTTTAEVFVVDGSFTFQDASRISVLVIA